MGETSSTAANVLTCVNRTCLFERKADPNTPAWRLIGHCPKCGQNKLWSAVKNEEIPVKPHKATLKLDI